MTRAIELLRRPRLDRITWIVLVITLAALASRLVGLGSRAVHHDEALHFMYSWYFAEGGAHHHDPLMHGPLQFHLIAAFFKLFGDSEFVGRLPHALAGTALVATPLLLRRYLNGPAVVLAALFFAISPALLYYSRFARNEPLIALFTVLGVVAMLRYRDTGRLRWLVLFTAMLALHFAAKETAYLLAAMFLLYFNGATAHELFWRPRRDRGESPTLWEQVRDGWWLIPTAWGIAAAWPLLGRMREHLGWRERPREADLLVVTATLVLPLLAAAVELPLISAGHELSLQEQQRLAWATVPLLLVLSAAVGLAWGRLDWAICFAVFMAILLPLYSTWGTNLDGVAGIFWTSLDYWIDQQEVQRAGQPWFFYVMLTPLYEGLVLLPGVVGGLWLVLRRRDGLATFLLWWFIFIFAALTYAGEKMPWLVVHITLPLCLLAAYTLGQAAPRIVEAVRAGRGSVMAWSGGGVASVVLASLLVLTAWTNIGLNIDHPSTPIEPFTYAQTTEELQDLSGDVIEFLHEGRATGVIIDNHANLTWPWAWYLRDESVNYLDRPDIHVGDVGGQIVIGEPGLLSNPAPVGWTRVTYTHYEWPHEATYRATTWRSLGEGILDGSLLEDWVEFLVERDPHSPLQYRDGQVMFPPPEDGATLPPPETSDGVG